MVVPVTFRKSPFVTVVGVTYSPFVEVASGTVNPHAPPPVNPISPMYPVCAKSVPTNPEPSTNPGAMNGLGMDKVQVPVVVIVQVPMTVISLAVPAITTWDTPPPPPPPGGGVI